MEKTGPGRGVQQHNPVHADAVTSVAALKADLCVSGGKDKVWYWPTTGHKTQSQAGKYIGRDVRKIRGCGLNVSFTVLHVSVIATNFVSDLSELRRKR